MARRQSTFASRGGVKLDAALGAFALDVARWRCADFGCNVGGFTDCLLQRGADKVYAVDTGYGQLAWKLRRCERVVVMERTNALYCAVPEPVDLVVIDVAWTPQRLIVPAALRWLKAPPQPPGRVVSLLKPHYEVAKSRQRENSPQRAAEPPPGPLSEERLGRTCLEVSAELADLGADIRAAMRSPLEGKGGNREFFLLIERGA